MEALVAWLGGSDALARILWGGTLVGARAAPLVVMAPWLVVRAAPPAVRAGLLLMFVVVATPLALAAAPLEMDPVLLPVRIARELVIGLAFALATSLPFFAFDWAGRLVDLYRGASLAEAMAPPTGERTSPVGMLYLWAGLVTCFAAGGHRVALAAFFDGLGAAPIGIAVGPAALMMLGTEALAITGRALAFATALAAPVAVGIVVVEVALGLLGRAAPQLPLFFVGMPLRAAVGLFLALLALGLSLDQVPGAFARAIAAASTWLRHLGS